MLRPDSLAAAVVLTALVALGPLSTDMYLPALPAMTRALGTDVGAMQLTLSVFLLGFACGQLVYGPLSDRFGRRPVLLGGIALFVLAGIGCLLADDIETLIAARFAQAVGACAGPVLGRAVVRDVHGREGAARVLAYMASAMAAAPLVAPLAGGTMVEGWGWRAIFGFLVLFGGLLLAAAALGLPETNAHRDPTATRPRRILANYLALLRAPRYFGYVMTNAFAYSAIFAFISGSSFVFIDLLGLSPPQFGLCFGLAVAGFIAGSTTSGRFTQRLGIERLIRIGSLACLVFGALALALALAGVTHVAAVLGPMMATMAGVGLVMPNSMAGAVGPFPQMAGAASALLGFIQMGMAAFVGFLVGQLHDGTQVPMCAALAAVGLGCFVSYRLMGKRGSKA